MTNPTDRGGVPPPTLGQSFVVGRPAGEPSVFVVTRIGEDGTIYVREQHIHHVGPEMRLDEVPKPDADK